MSQGLFTERPREFKKKHTDARTGCVTCKARKVKCGQERPACHNCRAFDRRCLYEPSFPQDHQRDVEVTQVSSLLLSPKQATSFEHVRESNQSTEDHLTLDFGRTEPRSERPMESPTIEDEVLVKKFVERLVLDLDHTSLPFTRDVGLQDLFDGLFADFVERLILEPPTAELGHAVRFIQKYLRYDFHSFLRLVSSIPTALSQFLSSVNCAEPTY